MSEAIKLKVPENPGAEKVSIGNNEAELIPGGTVETTNRKFAEHLIGNYGLEEIVSKRRKTNVEPEKKDFGFPADFPGKDHFEKAEIPYETVQGLTEGQLLKVENIGPETATKILNYSPQPIATAETEQPADGDRDDASTGEGGLENSGNGGEV